VGIALKTKTSKPGVKETHFLTEKHVFQWHFQLKAPQQFKASKMNPLSIVTKFKIGYQLASDIIREMVVRFETLQGSAEN
jgi:hypothetical protein